VNPAESLAQLCEKISRYADRVDESPATLKPVDINHALGLVQDSLGATLVRVKYCSQSNLIHDLDIGIWLRAVDLFRAKKWSGKRLRSMCQVGLAEHIDDHVCPICNGRKAAWIGSKLIECDKCRGTGRLYPSDDFRIEVLNLPPKAWKNHYDQRYRMVQSLISSLEDSTLSDLVTRLIP